MCYEYWTDKQKYLYVYGHFNWTNLNTVDVTHCLNLWFIGSQYSFSNYSFDICSLHCSFEQNIMQLFRVTCSLSFSFLSNLGTTQYRHNQSEVELMHYIEFYEREHLKYDFSEKWNSAYGWFFQLLLLGEVYQAEFCSLFYQILMLVNQYHISVHPIVKMFQNFIIEKW